MVQEETANGATVRQDTGDVVFRMPSVPTLPVSRSLPTISQRSLIIVGLVGTVVLMVGLAFLLRTNAPAGQSTNAMMTVHDLSQPYTATIPGPHCDTGTAQWQTDASTSVHCLATSMQVTAKTIGQVRFYGNHGNFARHFQVGITVDASQLNGGCAGIHTRPRNDVVGFDFFVCSTGIWFISGYNEAGVVTQLGGGALTHSSPNLLRVTADGIKQTFVVDGAIVATVLDVSASTEPYLALAEFAPLGKPGSATFSNFVFAPLS